MHLRPMLTDLLRFCNLHILYCMLWLALNTHKATARHVPTSRGHETPGDTLERTARFNRVVRLPPLVPPLHGDTGLVTRQVNNQFTAVPSSVIRHPQLNEQW